MNIDELLQTMREAGSLANIRECAERLKKQKPDDYRALCEFYAEAKRRAKK